MVRKTPRGDLFAALALPIAALCATALAPAQRLVLQNHLDDGVSVQNSVLQRLVLQNHLDDGVSVQNSVVGPDLRFATTTGPGHVVGAPEFVEAVVRDGLTTAVGMPGDMSHAHVVLADDLGSFLSPERGTIELWIRVDQAPDADVRDNYRAFSGPGDYVDAGIRLYVYDRPPGDAPEGPTLRFALRPRFDAQPGTEVVEIGLEYPIPHLGRWMKVDALWDRQGIGGTPETVRLYVDGIPVAASDVAGWGYHFGASADIGGLDGHGTGSFVVDELRVWDQARPPRSEPAFFTIGDGCPGAAGTPQLDARTGDEPYTGTVFTMCVTTLPGPRWCACWGLLGIDRETLFGTTPLPLDLGFLGMPDCSLYLSPEWDEQLVNHNGVGEWSVPIPNVPQLGGARFYTQIVVLDETANAFGAIWSNACEGRIGVMQ